MKMRIEQGKPLNLNDQLNAIGMGLLPAPSKTRPTPMACDADHGGPNSRDSAGRYSLFAAVHHWPTPTASDWNTPVKSRIKQGSKTYKRNLKEAVMRGITDAGVKLNPDWVEALMGYPPGWTDIDKAEASAYAGYPARWLDGTWEEGIPRVVNNAANRKSRLKCLGNAVVPQITAALWMMIMENKSLFIKEIEE
jgi:hypothetical protein